MIRGSLIVEVKVRYSARARGGGHLSPEGPGKASAVTEPLEVDLDYRKTSRTSLRWKLGDMEPTTGGVPSQSDGQLDNCPHGPGGCSGLVPDTARTSIQQDGTVPTTVWRQENKMWLQAWRCNMAEHSCHR